MAVERCCYNFSLNWSDKSQDSESPNRAPAYLNVSLPKTLRRVKSISTFWPSLRPGTPGMTTQVEVFPFVVDVVLLGQKERQGSSSLPYHDGNGPDQPLPPNFDGAGSLLRRALVIK